MAPAAVVATVIPTWQEATHIERCLRSLMAQSLAAEGHQILIMDGGSDDGTLEIVERLAAESHAADGPAIELHHNPFRFVPHARNLAMEHLRPDVTHVLEMIGHAWVPEDHIETRLSRMAAIEAELGRPLGGLGARVIESDLPLSRVGRWVESTLASPLGGSGQFARFSTDGPTKIPPFTLYRREALESVGGWNNVFITTQDSELNLRLLKADWPLWRTAETHVRMAKRETLGRWWKLGHRYGFWRMKHLMDAKPRFRIGEFLPWIGLSLVAGLAINGGWTAGLPDALWPVLAYLGALFAVGVDEARRAGSPDLMLGVPLLLMLLHTSFSVGLVEGLFRFGRPPSDRV